MMQVLLDEDQRLCLLRSLNEAGGSANESVLQTCLEAYGHRISRDAVRTHIAWLEEQRLVGVEDMCGCMVATLRGRGQDAAEGRARVPGVKRPRARE